MGAVKSHGPLKVKEKGRRVSKRDATREGEVRDSQTMARIQPAVLVLKME